VNLKSLPYFDRFKKIEKSIEKIPIWCQKTRNVLKFCSKIFLIFRDWCENFKTGKLKFFENYYGKVGVAYDTLYAGRISKKGLTLFLNNFWTLP